MGILVCPTTEFLTLSTIDLSVSPSPRTQMIQWQSVWFVFMLQKWQNDVPGGLVKQVSWEDMQWNLEFILLFNINFLIVILSLSYNSHLLKQNVNVILCFSKGSLAKTSKR